LVFKTSIGLGHGKGVRLVKRNDYNSYLISFGSNYIVQKPLMQHKELSKFNSTSVNVLRVTTLRIKETVYVLGTIFRVGAPGAFCDHNGFENLKPRIVRVDENGNLVGKALSPDDCKIYDDIFGVKISGKIPHYKEIIEKTKEMALQFGHHGIIGWDITIDDEDRIICIEFNSNAPGMTQTQMACGPVFANLTDNGTPLLDEIIKN